MSLCDEKQCMRQAKKADLGKYLKGMNSDMNGPGLGMFPVVIDGGWLLHQCSFESCETFGSICMKYTALVASLSNGQITAVVFDGYISSPKDHEHKRRTSSYFANISLNKETKCTMNKQRFLASC